MSPWSRRSRSLVTPAYVSSQYCMFISPPVTFINTLKNNIIALLFSSCRRLSKCGARLRMRRQSVVIGQCFITKVNCAITNRAGPPCKLLARPLRANHMPGHWLMNDAPAPGRAREGGKAGKVRPEKRSPGFRCTVPRFLVYGLNMAGSGRVR
jgi:hypothetical protein